MQKDDDLAEEWSLQDKKRIPAIMTSGARDSHPPQQNLHPRNLNKRDFKELFRYDENDRDKKDLKKDWKKLNKLHKKEMEFKHIIGRFCCF